MTRHELLSKVSAMGLLSFVKNLVSRAETLQSSSQSTTATENTTLSLKIESDPVKRGVTLLKEGDLPAARDAFREAALLNPNSAANLVNLAYTLQQTDAEDAALPYLRQAVLLDDQSFDAHYMLGGALERVPDLHEAAKHLRRALEIRPDFEPAHADLCRVLAGSGDVATARSAITAALALNSENAEFHHYLGNLCMTQSNPVAALESYAKALALQPDNAQIHGNKALALQAERRFDEAAESFLQALTLDPLSADIHAKLGTLRWLQSRLGEAAESLQRALKLQPDNPTALNSYGMVLQEQGQLGLAIASYQRAISLRPELPGTYANLGLALYEQGDLSQAVEVYRQGLVLKSVAEIHDNLAIALQKQGLVDEAIQHYHQALALQPDNVNTQCNLAAALSEEGKPADAIAAYRKILLSRPDHLVAHSNLLFHLSVDERCTTEDYLAEARHFDRKLNVKPIELAIAPKDTEGFLRIGFVSGDLRSHPVGYFLEGILPHLAASNLELIAYSTVARQDELTARIRPSFKHWRLLKGRTDEEVVRQIRIDEVDILFDLAGHSADNRLSVFSLRPAPLQVSWLGYFASTGLSAMDYVLADDACVPLGSDHQFSEKVWRLPQTRMCFTSPKTDENLEVSTLPSLNRGHITFGCFQRLPKITDAVLNLWGQVFHELPGAHLLLQSHQTGRTRYVEQILSRLARVGIAADRVTIRGPVHRSAYLQSYRDVDIVLDTFPFTGGTTTCEALWMGVPTVTLNGESMIARQGAAMLQAAGLHDWVAETPADYVRIAVAFASNLGLLAQLRASLRTALPTTPLFDTALFARRLEAALTGMWQAYLTERDTHKPDRLIQNVLTQSVVSSPATAL